MTNLKKTLAVVLAFAMILSMGLSSFAAYSDVTAGTLVSEAVEILSGLKILTGFEDGTFKPDETVTRAQMAAIICRTLGYEDQAKSSAGSTIFNDVAADHWASGYINVAQSLQIINGYGDGNFGPEDQVTYEQAVKMITVALGYELAAQAKGGWYTGYLSIASAEGITKNANGTVGSPATRATIAVLVYNSLEVPLMDQNTWSTGSDGDKYGKIAETVLSKYLEIQKWEGVVAETPYGDYAKGGYVANTTPEFSLAENAFYQEYVGANGTLELKKYGKNEVAGLGGVDAAEDIDCSLVDVNTLAGKKVVAYIGEDEDATTGTRMVYAIAEKQNANKVTRINATQLIESGDDNYSEDGVVLYRNAGSNRAIEIDLEGNATNGYKTQVITNFVEDGTIENTAELAAKVTDGGIITLISNDNDSEIDVILVTAYTGEAVVEAAAAEDGIIALDMYVNGGEIPVVEEIEVDEEDQLIIVYKDGALATVNDIAANDTISAVDTENDFIVLYVSSATVTGLVEAYSTDDEYVTIAGNDYEVSSVSAYKTVADLKDKEGIFFLNVDGQIAHDEAEAASGNYALVLAVASTTGVTKGYEVEVVLADGTTATYALGTNAYVEGKNDATKGNKETAIELAKLMGKAEKDLVDGVRINSEDAYNFVFEAKIKNGKITKLAPLANTDGKETAEEFDAENMSYGAYDFNDATVVFSVAKNEAKELEADDVTVGKVADFFTDGEGLAFQIYGYDNDNNSVSGLVLGYGLDTTIPKDGAAVIITSVKESKYNDEDAYYITGLQAGKEVSYTIYDDEDKFTSPTTDLVKGSVIMVGVPSAEGVVSDFQTLYSKEKGAKTQGALNDTDNATDEIYTFAGIVDEYTGFEPTDSEFFITAATLAEGSKKFYTNESFATKGVSMKSSANYTLVDYSESTSNPEVSRKSKSKSIFGTLSKYDSEVFVRYYDDKLVEVVVYRFKNGVLGAAATGIVAAPTADKVGEIEAGTVTLSAAKGDIYYTTDGTEPTVEKGTKGTSVTVDKEMTVKAIAVDGDRVSAVSTFKYTIKASESK